MRNYLGLLVCLIVSMGSAAQTAKPKPAALAQCERQLEIASGDRDSYMRLWNKEVDQHIAFVAQVKALEKRLEAADTDRENTERGNDLMAANLRAALAALDELQKDHTNLVSQYNQLLATMRSEAQATNGLIQSQQLLNRLAIYRMMPRYSPAQTIKLQVKDCTRLPALCD